ncbi:MAG: cadmium-translocating P-type ATPase [Chloroflexi bacterium]|nr:cadmium-translocating P-type ATPase [Chloroflexota bacterium]
MTGELELDIPILLPQIESDRDQCVARLQDALAGKRGIDHVHVHNDRAPAQLCLHYDPDLVSLAEVQRLAERAGATVANRYNHDLLELDGMDCGDCALVVEHGLARLDGVLAASVNYPAAKLRVEYDTEKVSRRAVVARVRDLGYGVRDEKRMGGWVRENWELALAILSGALLAIGFVLSQLGAPALVPITVYLLAYVAGGFDITRHALHAIRQLRFDIDALMVLAALGAALLGDFAEGALLLFLFSLGHALEHFAMERAHNAIRALGKLSPKTARVARDGKEMEIAVEQLQRGDLIIVRAGERIPIDGTIVKGRSAIDQSPITGESVPLDKVEGDAVFAGTVNGNGALEIAVTKLAGDTTLARVMQMVEEAQTQKSPTQRFTEKFESVFVPAVLVLDVALIVIPPILGIAPLDVSFYRAMALLVAASPCALAIGTPATILSAVAQAARNGVLVKGGAHLENLGALKAIAFDKTGTLTRGKPEVTDVLEVGRSASNPQLLTSNFQLLALAAAVESRSTHPLAQAVVRAAQARGLELPTVDAVEALTGRGMGAILNGATVLIGNLKLFDDEKVTVDDSIRQRVESFERDGKTTMIAAHGGTILGIIALADTPRAEAQDTLARLRSLGIRQTIMLTGDNERVAAAMAKQVGVSDYRANLMPEDKVTAIRELNTQYGAVAMVGDGVNDAPALANATVGIAMGGAGTDVALESADIALMGDDLSKLPFAVGLSRATRAVIRQNLAIALGVIGLLIIVSVTGVVSLGVAIIMHEGSTLGVVGNALRLLGFRDKNMQNQIQAAT